MLLKKDSYTSTSYITTLLQNISTYDNIKTHPFVGFRKHEFQVSYDLSSPTNFPSTELKKRNPSPPSMVQTLWEIQKGHLLPSILLMVFIHKILKVISRRTK